MNCRWQVSAQRRDDVKAAEDGSAGRANTLYAVALVATSDSRSHVSGGTRARSACIRLARFARRRRDRTTTRRTAATNSNASDMNHSDMKSSSSNISNHGNTNIKKHSQTNRNDINKSKSNQQQHQQRHKQGVQDDSETEGHQVHLPQHAVLDLQKLCQKLCRNV